MTRHQSDSQDAGVDYRALLEARAAAVAVWGLGHIGSRTLAAYAACAPLTIGIDPDEGARATVRSSNPTVELRARADDDVLARVLVHFVAVPTERAGVPCHGPLVDVLGQVLSSARGRSGPAPLIVIESTLTPGTTVDVIEPLAERLEIVLGVDVHLALAPRRDWFAGDGRHLGTIDRVFSSYSPTAVDTVRSLLEMVSGPLHCASSMSVCELVKVTENALRHLGIMLADQLAVAYPHADIDEVLRLAGTKWNIPTYHVGFGTGGYCIPVAGRYLLEGSSRPEALTLLVEAQRTEEAMRRVAYQCVLDSDASSALVLGLSYRPEVRVVSGSPSLDVARAMADSGLRVSIHDPQYSPAEISQLVPACRPVTDLLHAVRHNDAVLFMTDYSAYHDPMMREALKDNGSLRIVIDSIGLGFEDVVGEAGRYVRPGRPGWLTPTPSMTAPLRDVVE